MRKVHWQRETPPLSETPRRGKTPRENAYLVGAPHHVLQLGRSSMNHIFSGVTLDTCSVLRRVCFLNIVTGRWHSHLSRRAATAGMP
jgi:hypothetical protein